LALLGTIAGVTDEWDVPLMIARGFSSKDFIFGAAEHIASTHKPAYLYQIGDHDPSGIKAWNSVQTTLRRYLNNFFPEYEHEVTFERIAITPEQVEHQGSREISKVALP
jgi:hypothetical protein